jgi:hypothetical protein
MRCPWWPTAVATGAMHSPNNNTGAAAAPTHSHRRTHTLQVGMLPTGHVMHKMHVAAVICLIRCVPAAASFSFIAQACMAKGLTDLALILHIGMEGLCNYTSMRLAVTKSYHTHGPNAAWHLSCEPGLLRQPTEDHKQPTDHTSFRLASYFPDTGGSKSLA